MSEDRNAVETNATETKSTPEATPIADAPTTEESNVAEPVADSGAEPTAAPVAEPGAASGAEPAADSGAEPTAAPVAEPAAPSNAAADADEAAELAEAKKKAEFGKMLDQFGGESVSESPGVGSKVSGKIIQIGEDTSFVDFGGRSEGAVETRHLKNKDGEMTYEIGDEIELYVVEDKDQILLSTSVDVRPDEAIQTVRDAKQKGLPLNGKVISLNAGGFEIAVAGLRGFCPFSQIEIGYCAEPSTYVGQTLDFAIERVEEQGKSVNLVLSRKKLLMESEKGRAATLLATISAGQEIEGKVSRLQPFGAFIDLGGIDGMVHVSEIRHARTEHPGDVLKLGDTVRVRILTIDDKDGKRPRISLSIKAAQPDPWDEVGEQYWEGKKTTGTVRRLTDFGAFVELTSGVDGLVHVSEIAHRQVRSPADELKVGQTVEVSVLKVDPQKKRISLSIKDLLARDESAGDTAGSGGGASRGEKRPAIGDVANAVVANIKPYGIFADLPEYGHRARGLVPHEETGESKGSDLAKRFNSGDAIKVSIIDIDREGKIRLSMTAAQDNAERKSYQQYREKEAAKGAGNTAMAAAFKRAMEKGK